MLAINQCESKVLRSLTKEFDYVVATIEEFTDLSDYSFDALMSSLLAHETHVNRSYEKVEEKAFKVKWESRYKGKLGNLGGHNKRRGGYHGRGRGMGQGRGQGRVGSVEEG